MTVTQETKVAQVFGSFEEAKACFDSRADADKLSANKPKPGQWRVTFNPIRVEVQKSQWELDNSM